MIVGWRVATTLRAELALDALEMAIWARRAAWTNWCTTPTAAAKVDSIGRRNTSTVRSCDGNTQTASVGSGRSSTDAFTWSAAGGAA